MDDATDDTWMRQAVEVSTRAVGACEPNPPVGAVLAAPNALLSEGWTQEPGAAHAERHCLDRVATVPSDATLYVTLEPCDHWGRTPPCTDAILEHAVRRVVVALADPDPRVQGRGLARLRAAGVEVVEGVGADEARAALAAYLAAQP